MLVKERALCEGTCDLPAVKEEEDDNKFFEDIPIGLGAQSEVKINKGYSIQAATETFAPASNVLRFRLSCAQGKGNWTVCSSGAPERCLKTEQEEPQALVPCCDHKPLKFGICHHQDGAEFLQKYYSSGKTFLTLFRGGSAQVFYPSGHLALVVVTEENGSVCIVYGDSKAPNPVMRAVFQSDGRAACYHSNGNIWLSLNTSGGQCLDEAGARVRRWRWDGPLHPVFLSLNKAVGVRVLGRKQVFVSFLAQGQQAKFSVGTCCAQGESDTDGPASGPSATKEELIALAARDRTLLAIQNLHQCLMKHCQTQLPKTT
ncbi:glutamate-rich protein 6 [Hippoglossus hippoglossus]|uniref:glutamate-rich protein 6 n=1 Tax=Hippoglossus hippoglossus TaxID=8267 RepID=UPI00148B5544|nr:glutamate-rich protein 6 [Hippoglossus hippoglossus]